MDKELKNILLSFSDELHDYEVEGKDIPECVDKIWRDLTIIIENEEG